MLENFGVINLWTFMAGLIFIIIVPGPNSLYVLKTGASQGVRMGYRAAMGVFLGDALLIFCAYIGIASLIRTTPLLFSLVRYLGAFYLLYLGVKILYSTLKQQQAAEVTPYIPPTEKVFTKSLTLSLTNPKSILFYVSFFVQFIDFNYRHTAVPFALLAVILESMSFIYMSLLIFSGTLLARFFKRRQLLARLGNGLVGLFFLAMASRLATLNA